MGRLTTTTAPDRKVVPSPSAQRAAECTRSAPTKADRNGDVSLPVVLEIDGGKMTRRFRPGRWRAIVLGLVHVLFIAHFLHWLWAGETVTPVEPSESMEFVKYGQINAGLIFFALALLSTLLLGRWLCGWGCHLVAYQDLSLWVFKKLKLKPKAFRSRLLIFVPLIAALYMFVWPAVYRLWVGASNPPVSMHLTRVGFWDTFPGPVFAVLTVLICGVAMIYFLGPKGFCTYACPYGAFFGMTDKFAVQRIQVTDACRQCGHCTAVCTSNVNVAEEVNLYKQVVDPGCMRCLDCVSVCPNDALYVGWGLPSIGRKPASPPKPKKYDLTPGEELVALATFVIALFAVRGLYDGFPFLMSLGVAGVAAYLGVKAFQLGYQRDVRVQKWRLKTAGAMTRGGRLYGAGMLVLGGLIIHAGLWQYHRFRGEQAFAAVPPARIGWEYRPDYFETRPQEEIDAAEAAKVHFAWCERWGFFSSPVNDVQHYWTQVATGDVASAMSTLRRAIDVVPSWSAGRKVEFMTRLAELQLFAGQADAAKSTFGEIRGLVEARHERLAAKGVHEDDSSASFFWRTYGRFLETQGETSAAAAAYQTATERDGTASFAWFALGDFEFRRGNIDAARQAMIRAVTARGHSPQFGERLLRIGNAEPQDFSAAVTDYREAIDRSPGMPVLHANLAYALARTQEFDASIEQFERAIELQEGRSKELRKLMSAVMLAAGDVSRAVAELEGLCADVPDDDEAHLRLAFLYVQTGRQAEALPLLERVRAQGASREMREQADALLRQVQSGQPR